jgi:membrane protease YdiL (CAAX protease family)
MEGALGPPRALLTRLGHVQDSRAVTAGSQAVQNLVFVSLPCLIYGVVARVRFRLGIGEIMGRLGLKTGDVRGRAYRYALAAMALNFPLAYVSRGETFKGSLIEPYFHATPSAALIGGALTYAFLATGFPEELLFRGLIGGALFRRLSVWAANTLQALVFLLPHLLILLVAPQHWFLVAVLPFLGGLFTGWLRHTSGSIWPGVIVHGGVNLATALAVMNWVRE